MVVAMVVLSALMTLGGLTFVSVSGGVRSASHERFRTIALYSAESGVAAALDHLRKNLSPAGDWSAFVSPNNSDPVTPLALPGNRVKPGEPGNPFSDRMQAWYEVTIYNNASDPGLAGGTDDDQRVLIRSVGHGPDGATVTLELDVAGNGVVSVSNRPCPVYAQKGIAEDGAGRNDCLGTVNGNDVATFSPGGP